MTNRINKTNWKNSNEKPQSESPQNDRPKLVPPDETEFSRDWKPLREISDDLGTGIKKAIEIDLITDRFDTHSDLLPVTEAKRVISAIGNYNNFRPEKVGEALDLLHTLDPSLCVAVGLESSPVLYIHTERADYATQLLSIVRPDELNGNTGGGVFPTRFGDGFQWVESWKIPPDGSEVLIRAWWD